MTMTSSLRRRLAAAALLFVLSAPSCSLLGGGGTYMLSAYFDETVSLYPRSPVRLMGMIVGQVDAITPDGDRVRVDMTIDHDVPLPTDVTATISGLTLIGERTVLLTPPWKPGDDKASDGFEIEHTVTPVEPDEGLRAFVDLIDAIQPEVINQVIRGGAEAFGGHEETFNDLLGTTTDIWTTLGAQDDRLIEAANSVHVLASQVNQRDQQLNAVFQAFADTSQMLADQREAIGSALDGSIQLVDVGASLVDTYGGTLPDDLATIAMLGRTFEANTDSWHAFFENLAPIAEGIANAYDEETETFRLGANIWPTVLAVVRETLGRLLRQFGLCPPNSLGLC